LNLKQTASEDIKAVVSKLEFGKSSAGSEDFEEVK